MPFSRYSPAFPSPSHFHFPLMAESHPPHLPRRHPWSHSRECPPLPPLLFLETLHSTGLFVCASLRSAATLRVKQQIMSDYADSGCGNYHNITKTICFIQ